MTNGEDKAQTPPTDLRITLILGSGNHWRPGGITDAVHDPDTGPSPAGSTASSANLVHFAAIGLV